MAQVDDKLLKYYELAKCMAEIFSKDPNTKVGAILLYPDTLQIISSGYNGFPRGIKDTEERWERPIKYDYVVHAEANALYNACRNGTNTKGAIVVVTKFPCSGCCLALVQAGISKVVAPAPNMENSKWKDSFKKSIQILKEAEVDLEYVN